MIELRNMDVLHFIIIECNHLANDCTTTCGCLGSILLRYISCDVWAQIICELNTICFDTHAESVALWLQVVQQFTRRP